LFNLEAHCLSGWPSLFSVQWFRATAYIACVCKTSRSNDSPANRERIPREGLFAIEVKKIERDEIGDIFGRSTHDGETREKSRGREIRIRNSSLGNEIRPKFRNSETPCYPPAFLPLRPSRSIRLSPASVGVNGPGLRFRWYGHIWYTDQYMHHTAVRARPYIDYRRRERGTMECNQRCRERRAGRVNIKSQLLRLSRVLISGIFLRLFVIQLPTSVDCRYLLWLRAVLNSATLSLALAFSLFH